MKVPFLYDLDSIRMIPLNFSYRKMRNNTNNAIVTAVDMSFLRIKNMWPISIRFLFYQVYCKIFIKYLENYLKIVFIYIQKSLIYKPIKLLFYCLLMQYCNVKNLSFNFKRVPRRHKKKKRTQPQVTASQKSHP